MTTNNLQKTEKKNCYGLTIYILGHLVQSDLQNLIHTFIHRWRWLQCKVPTSTSRAVWGSLSCPSPLRHAGQGNRTSDRPITRRCLYPWDSLLGLYLLLIRLSSSVYSLLYCFIVALCVWVWVCMCVCECVSDYVQVRPADWLAQLDCWHSIGQREERSPFWAACWMQSLSPPISHFLYGPVSSSDLCFCLWGTQLQYNLVLVVL